MVAFAPLILNFFSVNNQIIIKNIFFLVFFLNLFSFFISGGCIHLFNFLCPRSFSFVSLSLMAETLSVDSVCSSCKIGRRSFWSFHKTEGNMKYPKKGFAKKDTFRQFFYFFWINQVQVTRLLNFAHRYVKWRQRNTKTWLIAFS